MTSKQLAECLQENRAFIDRQLERYLADDEPLLQRLRESVDYSLHAGGKRIRPLFCFLVGELFGVPRENLVSLACALEMIHTASLIMDDLPQMDDSASRRGKPANHLVYGQDVATLASVGLLTRAYEIVLEDTNLAPELRTAAVLKLAHAVGFQGMAGGQFADLHYTEGERRRETLDFILCRKTASLFVACGVTAAIVGGAAADEISALETYAKSFGTAFQILDDLHDHQTGSTDQANCISLCGEAESKRMINEQIERARSSMDLFAGKNEIFLDLIGMMLKKTTI